jgi:hypothetical protein
VKRVILEWGLILSAGLALALATLWVVSRFFDRSSYHLRVSTSGSVQDDLHLLVGEGDLSLCDQFDVDPSGNVRPLVVEARQVGPSGIRSGDVAGKFTIPGLDIRYCRVASDGYLIWSLKLSLLIPVVFLFLVALWLRRRLKRLRRRMGQGLAGDLDRRADRADPAAPRDVGMAT